jgi:hypothetical protein
MDKFLMVYPYKSAQEDELSRTPPSNIAKIVYSYKSQTNEYTPHQWKQLMLNPDMDYDKIDKVSPF